MILLLGFYFYCGWSQTTTFEGVQLAVYMTILFQGLVFTTTILYENDGFNYLHRVNGQYHCNSAFKVVGQRQIAPFILEFFFDFVIIMHMAGVDGIFMHGIAPSKGTTSMHQA